MEWNDTEFQSQLVKITLWKTNQVEGVHVCKITLHLDYSHNGDRILEMPLRTSSSRMSLNTTTPIWNYAEDGFWGTDRIINMTVLNQGAHTLMYVIALGVSRFDMGRVDPISSCRVQHLSSVSYTHLTLPTTSRV